jgi:hypothetical protein
MSLQRHWKWLALGLLLLGAVYAWFDFQSRRSESTLLARAHQYWEARRLNDYLTAYELEAETANGQLAPDEVETRPEWGQRVYSFQFGGVEYFNDQAEIELTLETIIREFTKPTGKSTSKDLWTFIKGQWYHGAPEKGGAGIRKPGSFQPPQPANPTESAPAPAPAQ